MGLTIAVLIFLSIAVFLKYRIKSKKNCTNSKNIGERIKLREERARRLDKPLLEKIDVNVKKEIKNQEDKRALLKIFMQTADFYMEHKHEEWIISHSSDFDELLYIFTFLLQRALNKGRTFALAEDLKFIKLPLPNLWQNNIGTVTTVGQVEGKFEKVKIQCCAVPVSKGKGRIICGDKIHISYPPLQPLMKDYDIFIKCYPDKPQNSGQWEAALILSIYSALLNRIMPPFTVVIGGIDKNGKLQPVPDIDRIIKRLLKENKACIFYPYVNKEWVKYYFKDAPTNLLRPVKHIEEIIFILKIHRN